MKKGKSFFDYSDKKKREIIEKAIKGSNRAQQRFMNSPEPKQVKEKKIVPGHIVWGEDHKPKGCVVCIRNMKPKQVKDWSIEFDKKSDPKYHGEDSLLYGTNGYAVDYPESEYELDFDKVKDFIRKTVSKARSEAKEELLKEIKEWAEKRKRKPITSKSAPDWVKYGVGGQNQTLDDLLEFLEKIK